MQKTIITIFFILSFVVCITNAQTKNDKLLKSEEFFKQVYDVGKCRLFDLRSIEEYNKSRLIDAVSAESKEKLDVYLNNISKEDRIFLYCEIGKRSQECAKWLFEKGFTNVYQLEGGFIQWKKSGFPIDSEKIKL